MQRVAILLCLAAATAFPAGSPRQDRWEIVGPGGGGALFFPTISPHDPSRVLVRCDMTGSYISDNAGDSWRMFGLRQPSSYFVFDPSNPNVIYVGGLGLWRSTDAGKAWSLVYPSPGEVTNVHIAGDHGEENILVNGQPGTRMSAFAVDPSDSHVLYGAIRSSLVISRDWGATWTPSGELADGARKIYVDPASPAADRTLYVIGNHSVMAREQGKWRQGPAAPGADRFTDVSAGFRQGSGGPPVIYALTDRILVSEDGGENWRAAPLPGTRARLGAIATSLLHPDTVYVSYSRLTEDDGRYYSGVARSSDRGQTWSLVWKSANQAPQNVTDAWITDALGAGWPGSPIGLGVAPGNADICYASDDGRILRTIDGGKTWRQAYAVKMPDGSFTSNGIDVTTSYGVHFDPFDGRRMFITYTDIGLMRSENGGRSWIYSGEGIPRAWRNTTYWMAFDPDVRGRVWGAMSRTHDLPRPKMWRRANSLAGFDGGISLSEDGGKTWQKSNNGMEPTATTHILIDPASPLQARVLYAAGFGRGVYKSTDGGKNWTLKNHGIEGATPFAWRLALDAHGALYLVVARRSEDGSIGNDGDGALYRSTDGAENWTKLKLPAGVNGPNGLTIDPADPKRLYLAAWGRAVSGGDAGGGVFISTDSGATWKNSLSADQHVYDVTVAKDVLYAAGFESSVWRSDDRGATWKRLRGYNFKWGHRVIPDPADADKIYVTTFGGSVWHGPAKGDPNATEDIAGPPPLRFTRP
jgi:photosystem II stability/assembly factor-like uncharacterized protein